MASHLKGSPLQRLTSIVGQCFSVSANNFFFDLSINTKKSASSQPKRLADEVAECGSYHDLSADKFFVHRLVKLICQSNLLTSQCDQCIK